MSEHGSFTTEAIFNDDDYKRIRQRLEDNRGKYLCCASPPYWENDEGHIYVMPIVSGKVGGLMQNTEWEVIAERISGVKTETAIRCVVMCEAGSVILVEKDPDGDVKATALVEEDGDDGEG